MLLTAKKPDSFDDMTILLNQLDKKLMETSEKLIMKNKLLHLRQREIYNDIELLTEKKESLIRGINSAFPLMRKKAKEMEGHHRERMNLACDKTRATRNEIAHQVERQIKYRFYEWDFDPSTIFDQLDAFLDLLSYTHQNLPVKDIDMWGCIERSIAFNYAQVQRIKVQLKSLHLDYHVTTLNLTKKIDEIQERQERLKKKEIIRHYRYQYYLDQFSKEDEEMIEAIEAQFKLLLENYNQKTKKAQDKAANRYVGAKKTWNSLQNARDRYFVEKYPIKALQKQMNDIVNNRSINEAKLRVNRVIMEHLESENIELKQRIIQLKNIVYSK